MSDAHACIARIAISEPLRYEQFSHSPFDRQCTAAQILIRSNHHSGIVETSRGGRKSLASRGAILRSTGHSTRTILELAMVVLSTLVQVASAQSIFTVAGGGSEERRPATLAAMRPTGVAVDGSGNLFIADWGNHRVRRVAAGSGIITTVAGNGGSGSFSGDGGPATAAGLYFPAGVAVDAAGNLFIADSFNDRIRKVAAGSSIITTVAGNGTAPFSGDGGPATAAGLSEPTGVAVDGAGNLFIADSGHWRIRKVAAGTGIITTAAGNGFRNFSGDGGPATAAGLSEPTGVAVDGAGNLFIADLLIRKVAAGTGIITTVAGHYSGYYGDGGPATAAGFESPRAVAVDGAGNLFIADFGDDRIRNVAAGSGIITTLAGNGVSGFSGDGGPATAASLEGPSGVCVDGAGNVFIADSWNNRVRKVMSGSGIIITVAGNGSFSFIGDGSPATAAGLGDPTAVAVDGAGNLYIAVDNLVRKVAAATGIITTVAGTPPAGFSGDGGPATAAQLSRPSGVAVDGTGNLFIADSGNNRIRRVLPDGIIGTVVESYDLRDPRGIAVDGAGNLFIADWGTNRIKRMAAGSNDVFTTVVAGGGGSYGEGGPATNAQLFHPSAVAVDGAGNLFIAAGNIRKVTAGSGIITTVAGNGTTSFSGDGGPATMAGLNSPLGVAVDGSGNVWISDYGNDRIRKVNASGIITTAAGDGSESFHGDGGPAAAAGLNSPTGMAIDGSGSLFIADSYNNRIRFVPACAGEIPTFSLASPANGSSGVGAAARLAWQKVMGAFRYDIYLDVTPSPQTIIASDIETTSFSISNLEPLTTYYWKIVAKGDPFCVPLRTAESEVRSFTTASVCGRPAGIEAVTP